MAYNKRVKLTADLIEAAKKHNCKIPKDAIKEILNDNDNEKVFGTTDYTDVSQTIRVAEELINKREKSKDELY